MVKIKPRIVTDSINGKFIEGIQSATFTSEQPLDEEYPKYFSAT